MNKLVCVKNFAKDNAITIAVATGIGLISFALGLIAGWTMAEPDFYAFEEE